MANTYITRTPSSNGNQKTWTWSGWIRPRGMSSSTYQYLMEAYYSNGTRYSYVCFRHGTIECYGGDYQTGSSTSLSFDVTTNRRLRDTSAWYHVVVAFDSTQATNTNRVKIYINGVQETSFQGYVGGGSLTWPDQNDDTFFNITTTLNRIGKEFDGCMAHVHFVDGTAYAASTFGETDSTSGIWVPKLNPTVTYGTNGFFLKFANSGNMDLDSSSNNLTFATTGTLTQTNDTPSNSFMVFNPLDNVPYINTTFSNANTTIATGSSYTGTNCNMWLTQGKWYWEIKCVSKTGDNDHYSIGIDGADPANGTNQYPAAASKSWMIDGHSGNVYNNNSGTAYGAAFGAGDIIGIALDLTNSKLYFSKNGTWQNSGVPTSGSTGTGAVSITAAASTDIRSYIPCATFWSGSSGTFSLNSGAGFFGTTAVASANADANGNGAMEYAVPSGYYTLCTKNIKEFGI